METSETVVKRYADYIKSDEWRKDLPVFPGIAAMSRRPHERIGAYSPVSVTARSPLETKLDAIRAEYLNSHITRNSYHVYIPHSWESLTPDMDMNDIIEDLEYTGRSIRSFNGFPMISAGTYYQLPSHQRPRKYGLKGLIERVNLRDNWDQKHRLLGNFYVEENFESIALPDPIFQEYEDTARWLKYTPLWEVPAYFVFVNTTQSNQPAFVMITEAKNIPEYTGSEKYVFLGSDVCIRHTHYITPYSFDFKLQDGYQDYGVDYYDPKLEPYGLVAALNGWFPSALGTEVVAGEEEYVALSRVLITG